MTDPFTLAFAKRMQARVRERVNGAPNWDACDQAYWIKAAEEAHKDYGAALMDVTDARADETGP